MIKLCKSIKKKDYQQKYSKTQSDFYEKKNPSIPNKNCNFAPSFSNAEAEMGEAGWE